MCQAIICKIEPDRRLGCSTPWLFELETSIDASDWSVSNLCCDRQYTRTSTLIGGNNAVAKTSHLHCYLTPVTILTSTWLQNKALFMSSPVMWSLLPCLTNWLALCQFNIREKSFHIQYINENKRQGENRRFNSENKIYTITWILWRIL